MKFSSGRRLLFIATAIATVIYLVWRALFTLPFEYGILSLAFGILLLLSEAVSGFESIEQYMNMTYGFEPEMPDIPASWFPDVDVLIMTHNEDTDLLYKTINACLYMSYPDKSKVHVYVCDDTDRPEMKELAQKMGVGYIGLSGNKEAKAGNMNNGLKHTKSPLVATFDADMIPRAAFLMETVPYFFLPKMKQNRQGVWVEREEPEIDPKYKIGFIQIPQGFYNPDLFQYNLYSESRFPNEQDYFFREINVGRNRSNSALLAGSNVLFSRAALADAGGIAVNTLTEDFETGIRIQSAGYTTYALSKPLAHGLAPHTIPSLMAQRERWGRGCIQSLRNTGFLFRKGMTLAGKISYFSCAVYWWTFARRLIFLTGPVLAVLFHLQVLTATVFQVLLFWLPHYLLTNRSLKTLSGSTRNQHWNNLIDTILCPYLIAPVILETLGIRKKKFVVTGKKRAQTRANNFYYAMPHIFLLAASCYALVLCIIHLIKTSSFYNVIIMFWLAVNIKNLFFAICFMLGRTNERRADRFYVELPVDLEHNGKKYAGTTFDISETGLAVSCDFPIYLPTEEDIAVTVYAGTYKARMQARVVHVDSPRKPGGTWRFSFHISSLDEENRKEYMQIVYDRTHTLPREITETLLYADFKDNIGKRLDPTYARAARKYPRIPVEQAFSQADGTKVFINDFNYMFANIRIDGGEAPDTLTLELAPGVTATLERLNHLGKKGSGSFLYKTLNLDELIPDDRFKTLVAGWARAASA